MITIRKASDRGPTNLGWLDSRHTFSFGRYHDPRHMGFRSLRVINDDRVEPKMGFAEHGHSDMEIISYVVEGKLAHKDSAGHASEVGPGGVQRMTAGSGIRHSEFNPSRDEKVRFLQIWIEPESPGIEPSYEDIHAPGGNPLRLIASSDARDGSARVHQDVAVYGGVLGTDARTIDLAEGRHAWVQVVRGAITVNGVELNEGDGAAISEERALNLSGTSDDAELLIFDLA